MEGGPKMQYEEPKMDVVLLIPRDVMVKPSGGGYGEGEGSDGGDEW